MSYRIRKVSYCHLKVPARKGQGAHVLAVLKDAGVNLLAFSGFPAGAGTAQVDLVAEDIGLIRRVGRKHGWRLSPTKKAFLATGDDRPGVVEKILRKVADAGINVTAADAVMAGKGRFGMIFWVRPDKFRAAARALNAK